MKFPSFALIRDKLSFRFSTAPVKYGLAALCAFCSANVRLLGSLSPFGMALAMGLPVPYSFAATAGALIGFLIRTPFADHIPYLIALLSGAALKLAVSGTPRLRSNPAFLSVSCTAIFAVCLSVNNNLQGGGTVDLIFCLAESLLGGAMTYFAFHASRTLLSGRKPSSWGMVSMASLSITALVALLGICQIELGLFNLGRILTVLLLLSITYRRSPADGAVCGLATGAVLTLYQSSYALSGGIYAIAAMLSGYFAAFGRLTQTAFFLLCGTVGVLLTGGDSATIRGALDFLAGSALFLIMPQTLLLQIPGKAASSAPLPDAGNRVAGRLLFAANTLEEIEEAVDAVSDKLFRAGVHNVTSVYEKTAETVCRKCGLRMFCWETAYNQTMDAFQKLTPHLQQNGRIDKRELPHHFSEKCGKPDDILQTVNSYYHEFISREAATRKVLGAKQVAAEQFEGIAKMLCEMSEEIADTTQLDPLSAAQISDLLCELGEEAQQVYCLTDQYDRLRVEIYRERPFAADAGLISERLSELLERKLDLPSVVTAGDLTKICFFEQARYTVDFSFSQLNAGSNKISGDCCQYFLDDRGFAHIILSDGMGTGGRAAVDSLMTCNFVLKLIKAGFGFDATLKFINSALLVKAGEESLATLDIGCIDLYTGAMEFLKAGAACSFVCRNGKTILVEGNSLPIGILQGIGYDRHTIRLQEGDLIVMVTDGAISYSPEWLLEEISILSTASAEEICRKLATLARYRSDPPGDDITVAAVKLKKAE